MPTSVHLPKPLLAAVDSRARALKVSRNRLIVQVLAREMSRGSAWSPDFFSRLAVPAPGIAAATEEMVEAITKHRRSKNPVRL